jgi:hypothetical protein
MPYVTRPRYETMGYKIRALSQISVKTVFTVYTTVKNNPQIQLTERLEGKTAST